MSKHNNGKNANSNADQEEESSFLETSFSESMPYLVAKVTAAELNTHHPCPFMPVRIMVIGLLCLGSLTTTINKSIMSVTIFAMAPQRNQSLAIAKVIAQQSNETTITTTTTVRVELLTEQRIALRSGALLPSSYYLYNVPYKHVHEHFYHHHQFHNDSPLVCPPLNIIDQYFVRNHSKSHRSRAPPPLLHRPEFNWTECQQNILLSAFPLGHVFSLIPAGRLPDHLGGRYAVALGGAGHVLLSLVSPHAARLNYWLLVVVRMGAGVAHAIFIPAAYHMMALWAPECEKSKSVASFTVGGTLGTIVLNLVAGDLCQRGLDGTSWALVFYLTTVLNLVWLVAWLTITRDRPAQHPWITADELNYMNTNIKQPKAPPGPLSWSKYVRLLSNRTLLAWVCLRLTHSWMWVVVQSKLPSYMLTVLSLNLRQTGMFNTVGQVVQFALILASGVLSDRAIRHRWASKTTIRKCFEGVASFGTAFCLVILAQTYCNQMAFLVVLTLTLACSAAQTGGTGTIIFDLTNSYAHSLVSLVSTLTTIVSVVTPSLVTVLLSIRSDADLHTQWQLVFYCTALMLVIGGIVFMAFASARRLYWLDESVVLVEDKVSKDKLTTSQDTTSQVEATKSNHSNFSETNSQQPTESTSGAPNSLTP